MPLFANVSFFSFLSCSVCFLSLTFFFFLRECLVSGLKVCSLFTLASHTFLSLFYSLLAICPLYVLYLSYVSFLFILYIYLSIRRDANQDCIIRRIFFKVLFIGFSSVKQPSREVGVMDGYHYTPKDVYSMTQIGK